MSVSSNNNYKVVGLAFEHVWSVSRGSVAVDRLINKWRFLVGTNDLIMLIDDEKRDVADSWNFDGDLDF